MGILDDYLPRYIQIESGGNPNARTGSYRGLLQMGPDEIAKYGGEGLEAGRKMYADRAAWFEKKFGRPPTPTELYLTNQQGEGGVSAHLANPDAPAWQNMYSTAEGKKKGEAWAKKAIWGNVPDDVKAQFPGGVDSLTSRQFVDLWQSKVERGMPSAVPPPVDTPQSLEPPKPLPAQPLNVGTQDNNKMEFLSALMGMFGPQAGSPVGQVANLFQQPGQSPGQPLSLSPPGMPNQNGGLPAFNWTPGQQQSAPQQSFAPQQQPAPPQMQLLQAMRPMMDQQRIAMTIANLPSAIRPFTFRG